MRLGVKDHKVIRAFVEKRAAEGQKLNTDGKRLNFYGLGGSGIAEWRNGYITFRQPGGLSEQSVQRHVRYHAAPMDLEETRRKAANRFTRTRMGRDPKRARMERFPIRHEDGKPDRRYTFTREYTGHQSGRPQWVARFADRYIGNASTRDGAVDLARKYEKSPRERAPMDGEAMVSSSKRDKSKKSVSWYEERQDRASQLADRLAYRARRIVSSSVKPVTTGKGRSKKTRWIVTEDYTGKTHSFATEEEARAWIRRRVHELADRARALRSTSSRYGKAKTHVGIYDPTTGWADRDPKKRRARDPKAGAFITDMGRSLRVEPSSGPSFDLPRYSAWVYDASRGKHQVKESSNDLSYLQKKYDVPTNRVGRIGRDPARRRSARR